jgi:hypothetical protein
MMARQPNVPPTESEARAAKSGSPLAPEMVAIPLTLAQATLNYLGRCPYVDVRPLLKGWEDAGILASDAVSTTDTELGSN